MTDWLSEIERTIQATKDAECYNDGLIAHDILIEDAPMQMTRMACVLRELARVGAAVSNFHGGDAIRAYTAMSDDAKELCVAARESDNQTS